MRIGAKFQPDYLNRELMGGTYVAIMFHRYYVYANLRCISEKHIGVLLFNIKLGEMCNETASEVFSLVISSRIKRYLQYLMRFYN